MVKWRVSVEKASPSIDDTNSGQIEEEAVDSTIEIVSSAVNDLSLSESDPLLQGTPNKRGQISLNHLLNFTFPPRQSFNYVPRRHKVTSYQPYNKERFVNANFRFIIKPTGDYTVYLVDPDILLNWDDIVQVIITIYNTPSCPICLQQPIAPRVTKCGHTYCFACILHYLQFTDDSASTSTSTNNNNKSNRKWRKCPICWDAVYAKDLKSVRFWTVRSIGKVGYAGLVEGEEIINMRLIQRQMNSTIALPRSTARSFDNSSNNDINNDTVTNVSVPWHFASNALVFSKLMLASFDYMQAEFNRDLKELDEALDEAKNLNYHDEIPFLEVAIVNVQEQLDLLQESYSSTHLFEVEQQAIETFNKTKILDLTTDSTTITETGQTTSLPIANSQDLQNNEEHEVNLSNPSSSSSFQPPDTFKYIPPSSSSPLSSSTPPPSSSSLLFTNNNNLQTSSLSKPDYKLKSKFTSNSQQSIISGDGVYYFYQSEDGQNIYLHPLDIRILKHEFGTYEQFPDEISFRIISVEESTMTEELRKKFKYLGHLPLSCDITFLEVDLEGVVSKTTLKTFSNELRQRLDRRKEKARREKRLHDQATNKESRQEIIDSDPFFQQPSYSYGGETNNNDDNNIPNDNNNQHTGPTTVWGTPAVTFAGIAGGRHSLAEEEQHEIEENNWDFQEEEVFFGKKNKKKKLILMSTSGKRQR